MKREGNLKNRVLELIKNRKYISRNEIAKEFGVTSAGVGKVVKELLNENLIVESKEGESTGGRKPVLLEINKKNIGKVLGVYFAPKFFQITIGNINGEMFESKRYDFIEEKNYFKQGEEVIKKFLNIYKDISIISIVTNGLVDSEKGKVIFSPHYNIKNYPLKDEIEKKFNIKTVVENDVRAMALTEKIFGVCRDNHNFVVLNIEDGVGGSIYLNDMLYHGYGSMSGELGHMVVKRGSLEKCSCGKRGCLETEVSNRAIIKKIFTQIKNNNRFTLLRKVLDRNKNIDINDILSAYEEKDMLTLEIVGEAISYIAYAMDMIISVINPEKIILYGDIFKSRYILDALLNEIGKITLDEQNYEVVVSNFLTSIYKKSPFAVANYFAFK